MKLLFYLAHSPLGSIVLLDFQPRQFVMVDGNLKVTDMDDASTEELSCKEDNDCTLDFPAKSFPLKCSSAGKCEGINEKKNLFNAYRYVQLDGGKAGGLSSVSATWPLLSRASSLHASPSALPKGS